VTEGTGVYLRTDKKRRVMGIIVKDLGGKLGRRRFTVAWIGTGGKPTDHLETDLVEIPNERNTITGTVNGNVIQAGTINGPITLNQRD
jgi:hypothetical protein